MSKQINKIVIVGGGSAGWMTASTLIKCFPEKEIILVESPGIPTVGVGESTIGGINNWINLLGLKDTDFMKATDASYKLSIQFTDFYKKGSGSFHYPFGYVNTEGNVADKNDWHFKKMLNPETPVSDYATCMYPNMALVNENKIDKNLDGSIPGFIFGKDTAYHFDATKFAAWLRDNYSIPRGVKHIQQEVIGHPMNEDGIEHLVLKNGETISADLFIDCTGFKSHLLAGAMQEPFTSYEDILPNNSAWATRVPYIDKEKELVGYTDCHAIGNGWVWSIPLWSRLGTGYVYSDKFVSDEDALEEFKEHLESKGYPTEDLEFRKLKMRVGIHERLWVKNVCAIGLSAGFIEPLESNGLFTIHEFLFKLVRTLGRGFISEIDKNLFSSACKTQFKQFADFVALHYALSHRDDTEYWRAQGSRDYSKYLGITDDISHAQNIFQIIATQKYNDFHFIQGGTSGLHAICVGLNYMPTDMFCMNAYNFASPDFAHEYMRSAVAKLEEKVETWKSLVENSPKLIDYLQENIYNAE